MNPEQDDENPPAAKPVQPGDGSESLNDALDDLEDMLDHHDGGAEEPEEDDGDGETPEPTVDDAQYDIPLLSDVVTVPPLRVPDAVEPQAVDGDEDYSESVQRMAERLSSEIDVIVQSAVDEAIDLLRRDIGERLREHLDITLPEVLEELVHLRRR